MGYAEYITDSSNDSRSWYLPHQYLSQIHELIIVLSSKPDSVVKNSCNYVNDRNIVTTNPKNYYN